MERRASHLRYSVYGLLLESDVPLPGLAPSNTDRDAHVVVCVEPDEYFPPAATEFPWYVSEWLDEGTGKPALTISHVIADGSFTFRYAEGVEFRVDAGGGRVVARFASRSCFADMVTFLTGPVLGVLLRMRGVIALHASAIDVGEKAIVLAGDAFAGKSTTAVMFARMGCRILTEDIAPLSLARGRVTVSSGCTDVALRPDAVKRLYGSVDALPKFSDNWDKHRLDLAATGAFTHGSLPVAAIYMLTNHARIADVPCVMPMSSGEAMVELLANIYGNRLLHPELRLRELDTVHHVVSTIPVKAAVTGGRNSPVERFCEVVLDDVRAS